MKKNATHHYSEAVKTILAGLNKDKIPEPSRRAIDKACDYEDRPLALKSLNSVSCRQRDSQKRVRQRMIRVLCVLITFIDWASLRIGVAKPDELDPVKHRAFRQRYKAIYGEELPESTWFRYVRKLIDAGYLTSTPMNIVNSENQIRGVAGYKCLTMKLLKELGFKAGWLDQQRQKALTRLGQAGLSNLWPVYSSKVAKQKRAAFLTLEAHQTESKQGEFDTVWCPDPAFVSLTH